MTSPRVQDVISWRRPRRQRRGVRESAGAASGLVRAAVDLALSIANGNAPTGDVASLGDEPPRVPRDPAEPVAELPCAVVGGTADRLAEVDGERPTLWTSRRRTWAALPATSGAAPADVELDRTTLTLRSLTLAPAEQGPWTLDALCSARVTGPGTELDLEGSWLALAWLGHLAGWPDPGAPGSPAVGR
ncbi:hypothetical protein ACFQ8E_07060 [Isoptericola sp. NPDC056573]|uniref:hypothetical protein n=1 Tax=Isoptericola sp. NPDC056573 TaxID=3345868 RepID=UPI0036C9300B